MIARILARPVPWLLGLLALFLLTGFTVNRCSAVRQAQGEARLSDQVGKAGTDNAGVAIQTGGAVAERAADGDALTRETNHAIRSAPDAAGVHAAGLDGLCKRAAYRCTSDCLHRTVARGVAKPGAGCPPAAR